MRLPIKEWSFALSSHKPELTPSPATNAAESTPLHRNAQLASGDCVVDNVASRLQNFKSLAVPKKEREGSFGG
jgi:hypothetical protein